ncbi:hypothetical protein [Demequina sediminis]|nr:hypothetical protein [Demequina sediminis]
MSPTRPSPLAAAFGWATSPRTMVVSETTAIRGAAADQSSLSTTIAP